jgi:hypothetical protein
MYDADMADDGFVWDNSKLWAHQPALDEGLTDLIVAAGLSTREKAMLVIGEASAFGDSYCSFAWSRWPTEWEDAESAVASDPNGITPQEVQRLRGPGALRGTCRRNAKNLCNVPGETARGMTNLETVPADW